MTTLIVYRDTDPKPLVTITDVAEIATRLNDLGVRFERVDASVELADDAGPDDVLAAYGDLVARNKADFGYQTADVIRLPKGTPNTAEMRKKFLSEHIHAEDEARMFVEGAGCFYLHLGDQVFQAVLERGDYISVPAGTKHWFDMGPNPYFAAIRFFTNPEGWVAQFTGDAIADSFPKYE